MDNTDDQLTFDFEATCMDGRDEEFIFNFKAGMEGAVEEIIFNVGEPIFDFEVDMDDIHTLNWSKLITKKMVSTHRRKWLVHTKQNG